MTSSNLPWFQAEDTFTKGSAAWLAAAIVLLPGLERYGLKFDADHPGNRAKWTLTSNWLTFWGWDSITGKPADVKFGALRRTIGACTVFWLVLHWVLPVPKRGVY